MKTLILGLVFLVPMAANAKSYIPKDQSQEDQLVEAVLESLVDYSISHYEKINSKMQAKLRRSGISKSEIKENVSFHLADDLERFLNCNSRIIEEINADALNIEHPSYDSFLTEVVSDHPEVKAPLVLMRCNIYSYDLQRMDEDFVGKVLFEIDQNGDIERILKN